jgi:hypothetical protein
MPVVEMEQEEWQAVLNIIANAPWRDANPLLMKIGDQLRAQQHLKTGPINSGAPAGETKQ